MNAIGNVQIGYYTSYTKINLSFLFYPLQTGLKVPPTIVESQTSQAVDVIEHSNAIIQCKADGHPKVNISWRRDDGLPIKLKGIGRSSSFIDGDRQVGLQPVISIGDRK